MPAASGPRLHERLQARTSSACVPRAAPVSSVVSISHGWTAAATWKVRCYETLDRFALRWMDAVVCVSSAQAEKVRRAKVAEAKIVVILNGIGADAFAEPNADGRTEMTGWFTQPPRWIVGSAGRLSPEKGFPIFIEAAALVVQQRPHAGFVLFGAGPVRTELEQRIAQRGLTGRFVLAGFRDNLNRYLPNLDLAVMSSYTEGLPVFLLEAGAAAVPAVATAVGGIPEVIVEGQTGHLVPPGDPRLLAERIVALLDNDPRWQAMGRAACSRVQEEFSFNDDGRTLSRTLSTRASLAEVSIR